MRLADKKLVMLVYDGIEEGEFDQLKAGFEGEGAEVLVTTPQEFACVETVSGTRRGREILIDLPLDAVPGLSFDGIIIPDGLLSTEGLKKDRRVIDLLFSFHQQGLPVFASGNAVQLLYESRILSEQVAVREGTALPWFIDRAVGILIDAPLYRHRYRPSS